MYTQLARLSYQDRLKTPPCLAVTSHIGTPHGPYPTGSLDHGAHVSTALLFLLGLITARLPRGKHVWRQKKKKAGRAVILPVRKDAATGQYVITFGQRTPLVPVTAVLDLANPTVWVDCKKKGYVSSTYRGVHGALCPSCLNGTCGGFPENTVTCVSTSSNIITDALALPTTFCPAPAFLFTCGATFLTEGLVAGATGMASLSRARIALSTKLAATFCLLPASAAGVVVFGDAPYAFQPGVDLSKSLAYTLLLVKPVSTAGVSTKCDKSDEYFVGVTGIKVNGRAVPLNVTLLAIDRKSGAGGAKIRTMAPYTVPETSIHKAVTKHVRCQDVHDPACTGRGAVRAVLRWEQGQENARWPHRANHRASDAERGGVVGGVRGEHHGGHQGRRALSRRAGRWPTPARLPPRRR
jgi:hypothetical protein